MDINNKLLVVFAGPTAVGKTELAIQLAKEFHAPIISADARQFYKEMEIGTAKPSSFQLAEVPHYFINNLSIHDSYDVNQYENEVIEKLNNLFQENDIVILSGGSGLFIQAVLYGLNEMPAADANQRIEIENAYHKIGIEYLQEMIQKLDPDYAKIVDLKNPHRLMRAIEVCLISGKTYSSFMKKKDKVRNFSFIAFNLSLPREILYKKIDGRVNRMMKNGLFDEVKTLYPYRKLNALNTVGYAELFQVIDGKEILPVAVDKIKQHTRNYAKRQITWFKKMVDFEVVEADYFILLDNLKKKHPAFKHSKK